MASRELEIVIKAQDKASGNISKVQKSAGGLSSKLTKLKGPLMAVVAAVLALGAAMFKAFTAARDFNRGLASIATLIPNNRKRIEEMRVSIQTLSVQMGQTTDDLTQGMFQVVSAFGDSAEAAEQLRIVSQGAAAGGATTVESLNLLSAVTKGYGDTSAEALQKASDLAFMTNKLGQTTFPELAASMGRVVPLSATLNVSQEELFASFATLTGVTGNANEVSTQMAAIQRALIKTTPAMSKAIRDLGFESGKSLIEERGLVQGMNDLIGTTDGSQESVTKLFGSAESLTAVFALTGSQADVFNDKLAQMKNATGASEQAFKDMTEGVNKTGFEWEQLKSRATILMQVIGQKLDPVFRAFIKAGVIGIKGILFGMESLEQTWNVFKVVANVAINTVAKALVGLAVTLKAVLFPLDKLADKAVALGLIDVNPFDAALSGLKQFERSSQDVLDDSIQDVKDTNSAYNSLGLTMDGIIEKVDIISSKGGLAPMTTTATTTATATTKPELEAFERQEAIEDPRVKFGQESETVLITQRALANEQKLEQLRMFHAQELALLQEKGATESELNMAFEQQQRTEAQHTAQFRMSTAADVAGALSNIAQNLNTALGGKSKKAFKVMQAAAIAQTAIDTSRAAMGAYSSLAGIPIVGPILGVAAAGAAVAAGMAQIQQIKSQSFGGGGSVSMGGGANPSRTGGGASAQGVPVRLEDQQQGARQDVNITIQTDTGIVPQESIDKIIEGINLAGTTRNVKVEGEAVAT